MQALSTCLKLDVRQGVVPCHIGRSAASAGLLLSEDIRSSSSHSKVACRTAGSCNPVCQTRRAGANSRISGGPVGMALADAPGGQVTMGTFLNSLQRDWNRPNLWQQHLNALNTRGPPAAEVAIATAFSSLQVALHIPARWSRQQCSPGKKAPKVAPRKDTNWASPSMLRALAASCVLKVVAQEQAAGVQPVPAAQGAFLGGMMGNFTKNPAIMDQMAQSGQPPGVQHACWCLLLHAAQPCPSLAWLQTCRSR